MLGHEGFKPLWPVILFLPWALVGLGYMIEWLRHRRVTPLLHAAPAALGAGAGGTHGVSLRH